MVSNKIFLFADLDDTFIQNEKKTDFSKEPLIGAYNSSNRASSYIYRERKEFLDKIVQSGYFEFVPTTARNLESYSRTIFYQNYNFEHVILNFSGIILNNNRIDSQWQGEIRNNYFKLPINTFELLQLTERYFYENFDPRYIPEIKSIDNQYVSIYNRNYHNNIEITKRVGQVVASFVYKNGFNRDFYIYQNGASFGILPNFLNKKRGVEYLINRYKPPFVLGAGDNVSDLDFMNLADFSLVPKESTLNRIMGEYISGLKQR